MSCEYCDERMKSLAEGKSWAIYIADKFNDGSLYELCHEELFPPVGDGIVHEVEIHYCPMCGEKLGDAACEHFELFVEERDEWNDETHVTCLPIRCCPWCGDELRKESGDD